jgi:hypothetical protein
MILSEALRLYCKKQKIGPRSLARATGLSPIVASRFLGGASVELDNFSLILSWALRTPSHTEAEQHK